VDAPLSELSVITEDIFELVVLDELHTIDGKHGALRNTEVKASSIHKEPVVRVGAELTLGPIVAEFAPWCTGTAQLRAVVPEEAFLAGPALVLVVLVVAALDATKIVYGLAFNVHMHAVAVLRLSEPNLAVTDERVGVKSLEAWFLRSDLASLLAVPAAA